MATKLHAHECQAVVLVGVSAQVSTTGVKLTLGESNGIVDTTILPRLQQLSRVVASEEDGVVPRASVTAVVNGAGKPISVDGLAALSYCGLLTTKSKV